MASDVPIYFRCPLSGKLMEDPVVDTQGHNYEKKNISEWLQRRSDCRVGGEVLHVSELRENVALRQCIDDWKSAFQTATSFAASPAPHSFGFVSPALPAIHGTCPPVTEDLQPWTKFNMSREEYDRAYAMFMTFDTDDSGQIDRAELIKLCENLGYPSEPGDIDAAFRSVDTNRDGILDFHEFISYLHARRHRPELSFNLSQMAYEALRMQFHAYDVDKDGRLTLQELTGLCQSMHYPCEPTEMHRMFYEMDTDRNGSLDMEEFLQWMSLHHPQATPTFNARYVTIPSNTLTTASASTPTFTLRTSNRPAVGYRSSSGSAADGMLATVTPTADAGAMSTATSTLPFTTATPLTATMGTHDSPFSSH
eukprot:NODE_858_length_1275_cov_203.683524_g653_i0.p1 GENE.NODE_858_length_1275_cov_203.683524_g653_i0~~NODE_858_length_1275_cov_203.683524_g653_i0.p1  ORF type:complete len:366 (-),score=65.93 NODE_858_length_1275_cov_203.683524_g653_i0:91-1188(-)